MTLEAHRQLSGDARLAAEDPETRAARASLAEIRSRGFREDSWDRIAAAAGLTPRELTRRYPDEQSLLVATLRYRDDRAVETVPDDPCDGRAMLQAFIDIASNAAETPASTELFANLAASATSPDHPGHDYFEARDALLRGLLVDALRELEEEGELRRRCDPQEVATKLITMLDGLQVQWLLDREVVDLEAMMRTFLDKYLHQPLEPGDAERATRY